MQFLVVPILILIVIANLLKKKKEAEAKEKQASLNRKLAEMEASASAPKAPPMQAAPSPARPVLPTKKPPQVPKKQAAKPFITEKPVTSADMAYISPEGTELHEDKDIHGTPHIAAAQPVKAETKPRYTAEQLKNAFIMKEILDAPVSRRENRRVSL